MGDIVHNRPLVVEAGPGPTTSAHLEHNAAERPDIDGAKAAFIATFDDLGRHVHRSARHGLLLRGYFGKSGPSASAYEGFVGRLECFVLTSYDFCGPEINVLDDTVVVKEDVYGFVELATRSDVC